VVPVTDVMQPPPLVQASNVAAPVERRISKNSTSEDQNCALTMVFVQEYVAVDAPPVAERMYAQSTACA
jgi:hypothetical protein